MPFIEISKKDALEGMKYIDDKSVDMVLVDPPYGKTSASWDNIIPIEIVTGKRHILPYFL